jgi:hypothetical protein
VDDNEADYLRGRIRELETSRDRWRGVAAVLGGALALVLAAGAVGGLVLGGALTRQHREEAARQAASSNLKQIAIPLDQADAPANWPGAEGRVREQDDARAGVAGGLGVAAFTPAGGD